MNSLPLCTAPEGREAEYMSLYPVIFPFGEMGRAQERWITLDDTVVAVNDSTGPGAGEGGKIILITFTLHGLTGPLYHPLV